MRPFPGFNSRSAARLLRAPRTFLQTISLAVLGVVGGVLAAAPSLAGPAVVTSIKPVHSIASAVMKGIGTPDLLIDGAATPHGFSLRPSQASMLAAADVVFWIGPSLSPSLAKPIANLAGDATVVELMDVDGIDHLDLRDDDQFEAHDHEESDHKETDHEHADDAGHGHSDEHDAHIWLNPMNGKAIAAAMAVTLARVDPDNAAAYLRNAQDLARDLDALDTDIAARLAPVKGGRFIVFHDAYHHFEHRYGLEASGAITLHPEAAAGADHISRIRDRIREAGVACVFTEPQFDSKLVAVVTEGTDVRSRALDPLGSTTENGPGLYRTVLSTLADTVRDCLSGR